jgi:hypothetical protein
MLRNICTHWLEREGENPDIAGGWLALLPLIREVPDSSRLFLSDSVALSPCKCWNGTFKKAITSSCKWPLEFITEINLTNQPYINRWNWKLLNNQAIDQSEADRTYKQNIMKIFLHSLSTVINETDVNLPSSFTHFANTLQSLVSMQFSGRQEGGG